MIAHRLEDRRTFQRFAVDLPLLYARDGQDRPMQIETRDVSAQGIGVTLDRQLPVGTPLHVTLCLPSCKEEYPADGTIVWTKDYGTSIRAGIRLDRAELMEVSTILRIYHPHAS
jgi:hypothetical protein